MPGLQPLKSSKHKIFFEGFQLPKKPHLLQQEAYLLYRIALTLLRFRWVLQWPGAFLQSPMGSAGQSLCEIARAAQQEKEDSEMVRRSLGPCDDGNIKTLEKNLPTISLHLYTFLHLFTRNCNWPLQNGTYVFFLPVFYFYIFGIF